jgi:hypothetical protein
MKKVKEGLCEGRKEYMKEVKEVKEVKEGRKEGRIGSYGRTM